MGEITITMEEYKELIAAKVRIEVFADFVNRSKYSPEREECGKFLGFEVNPVNTND